MTVPSAFGAASALALSNRSGCVPVQRMRAFRGFADSGFTILLELPGILRRSQFGGASSRLGRAGLAGCGSARGITG